MFKVNKYTPVRFSHLLGYAGVGSIVRASNDLLIVIPDTRYWNQDNLTTIEYSTRISNLIAGGKNLKQPPISHENKNGHYNNTIPGIIFPKWGLCNRCGLLHPKVQWNGEKNSSCACSTSSKIEQVTFVGISNKGYLDDVPWHNLAHKKVQNHLCRPRYDHPYLKLNHTSDGRYLIECTLCGSKTETRFKGRDIFKLQKQQPWYKQAPEFTQDDKGTYLVVRVNDPRLYNPHSEKALVIPPESRRMIGVSIIDRLLSNNKEKFNFLSKIKQPFLRTREQKKLAKEWNCSPEEIQETMINIQQGLAPADENTLASKGDILLDEYKALTDDIDDYSEDHDDFITIDKTSAFFNLSEQFSEAAHYKKVLKKVVAVTRLREINVFQSFTRDVEENDKLNRHIPPDLLGESTWLPAVELWGEGIFLEFNYQLLEQWEENDSLKKRAREIADKYEQSSLNFDLPNVSPRFLLLHTISHLIIRELEINAGYPTASLSERIYCSEENKMAGILIYTSVPDESGTLGGIIELTHPHKLIEILGNVFQRALWCSLDPVCSEHTGQGVDGLNKAACHGCSLISDTACSYMNVLLDRTFIKGSEDEGIPNFINFVKDY